MVVVFVLAFCSAFSQQLTSTEAYDVDSLRSVLPGQEGEERVNTLNSLTITIYYEDFDLGEAYVQEAMKLAEEINYPDGMAAAHRFLGHIHFFRGEYSKALNSMFAALELYEEADKRYWVAKLFHEISVVNYYAGNSEKAIEYSLLALERFRESIDGGTTVGNVRDTIVVFLNLGEAYYSLGMKEKALRANLDFLEVAKKNNFAETEIMLLTFVAGTSFHLIGEKYVIIFTQQRTWQRISLPAAYCLLPHCLLHTAYHSFP